MSQKDTWIDIARTGTFKASNGKATNFTSDVFDKLIQGFDERTRRNAYASIGVRLARV